MAGTKSGRQGKTVLQANTDRHANKQVDRQTDRQTDRKKDK